ncbi:hypothetical protein CEXT_334321 [Caerostris extrusa]|uniref:Uncharacterized protein n=1 Tax=Caerostris extrusa TaxID=172846 RepID=A0AAV4SGH0_CAEEX|nr:hypothetical protein CEXT_334321 [Caerostris extrusa]
MGAQFQLKFLRFRFWYLKRADVFSPALIPNGIFVNTLFLALFFAFLYLAVAFIYFFCNHEFYLIRLLDDFPPLSAGFIIESPESPVVIPENIEMETQQTVCQPAPLKGDIGRICPY